MGVYILLFFLFPFFPSCSNRACPKGWICEKRTVFKGMEAEVHFEVPYGQEDDSSWKELLEKAFLAFEEVEAVADAYSSDSEIGRLNSKEKVSPVQVSTHLSEMLRLSKWAYEATEGAFDPTVWPLVTLWRKSAREGHLPSEEAVKELRPLVGFGRIGLMPGVAIFPEPKMALDLGGIAKGYAVDLAVRVLEEAGVRSYLVRCEGEVAIRGYGRGWRIGISNPFGPEEAIGVIEVPQDEGERLSISTSGPYQQPLIIGGRAYNHIIDPRTLRPSLVNVLSVTVVMRGGRDFPGARADALATGLSVLGPKKGLSLASSLSGVSALFIYGTPERGLQIEWSEGMEKMVKLVAPTSP